MSEFSSKNKIHFSILMRVHKRPNALTRALNSILAQDYPNIRIIISTDCDDIFCYEVIDCFRGKGLKIDVFKVKPIPYPACNLYINELAIKVDKGSWSHVLDDKNWYRYNNVFKDISEIIENNNPSAVIAKFVNIDNTITEIPPESLWGKRPVLCQFGSPNMFVPYDKLKYMIWTERHPGDYDGLIGVYDNIDQSKVYWFNKVIVNSIPGRNIFEVS
jgi:hypothetical protein